MTLDLPALRARAEEAEALRAMMLKKDVRPECEGKSRCCGPWVLVEPAIILTVREQDEVMYSLGQANDDRAALLAEVERLSRNLEYASAECADLSAYRQLVREEHPAEVAALTAEVERLREEHRIAIGAFAIAREQRNELEDGRPAELDRVARWVAAELRPDLSPAEIDAPLAEAPQAPRGRPHAPPGARPPPGPRATGPAAAGARGQDARGGCPV